MISIGLDLSINSTGVCVYDSVTRQTEYYIIGTKFTKKSLEYHHDNLNMILCEKRIINTKDEYHMKESIKTSNIYNIVVIIRTLIEKFKPNVATIEGVSFQSNGSVLDLCGLNYMVRMMLQECNVPNMFIVSPTQNKKFATGNGQAEKDVMISAWHKLEPHMKDVPKYVKVDDISDAYFLARYGVSLLS